MIEFHKRMFSYLFDWLNSLWHFSFIFQFLKSFFSFFKFVFISLILKIPAFVLFLRNFFVRGLGFFKEFPTRRDFFVYLKIISSDATGLGRTRQKPDLDYFLQTETRTRFFNITPNQTRWLISDENKYKNPTKNPNPAEPEAKMQTDPKPEPDCLNLRRSRTRLFETRCVTTIR